MAALMQAVFLVVFLSVYFLCTVTGGDAARETYYIGFLSPLPSSSDSLIPSRLAQQWQSAFRVALEVLNAEDRPYQLEAVLADTACNWMKVMTVAEVVAHQNIIGVVGPACSGAALSAAQYFARTIPIVSFAATHDSLSDRNQNPNFFRTVYGDRHQTLAVLATMEKLDMWNVTILCSKDYYSMSLGSSIQLAATERVLNLEVLDSGENSSVDANQLEGILSVLQPSNFVILAVPPLVAEEIWRVATNVGKTSYPWWYFGTDGATAFDPYIEGSSLGLIGALQGEIGIAPYVGDYNANPQCQKFFDYWRKMAYPELPLMGVNKTGAYVPHLLDTVTLYFEIVDALVKASVPVNASTVLSLLKGSESTFPNFTGCTGNIQIDPETGSRRVSSDQPATYDLVSLVNSSWEVKGIIHNTTFVSMQPIVRPISTVEDPDTASNKRNGGIIAGFVLFTIALFLLLGIVIVYYKKRQNKPLSFVRILHP